MKLTYRGIKYQATKAEANSESLDLNLNQKSTQQTPKASDRIIQVRPVYYTYRGVSYTKNLFFDYHSKSLLDIDYQ